MTVVAPFAFTYTNRVPYLSIAEFKAAPTGIDLSNLIEDGTQPQQDQALTELIARASAKADNYCMGAYGTLCATLNTENARIRADRRGQYRVHPKFWPILAVTAFSVGPDIGNLTAIPLSTSTCWIEESGFVVAQGALSSITSVGPLQFGGGVPGAIQYAQWSYVNGWPNLFLASQSNSGTSSLTAQGTPQGIFPGTSLNVWDPATNDEVVTVANTYVAGSSTIPLTAPLANTHAAGVNVSALPQSVKQAVIYLVTSTIRLRGEVGFTLGPEGAPSMVAGKEIETEDEAMAYDILDPFRCVVK